LPFAPIGSERYGMKNTFAVIEFAKPEAAGLFFCLSLRAAFRAFENFPHSEIGFGSKKIRFLKDFP